MKDLILIEMLAQIQKAIDDGIIINVEDYLNCEAQPVCCDNCPCGDTCMLLSNGSNETFHHKFDFLIRPNLHKLHYKKDNNE